jgi:hypothetical protein
LKVVEVEGVGPVGGGRSVGIRGKRKRFWKEKKNPYTLLSLRAATHPEYFPENYPE